MCSRYSLTSPPEAVRAYFGYSDTPNFPARYNVAPTQAIGVVALDRQGRVAEATRHYRAFLSQKGAGSSERAQVLVVAARGDELTVKSLRNAAQVHALVERIAAASPDLIARVRKAIGQDD